MPPNSVSVIPSLDFEFVSDFEFRIWFFDRPLVAVNTGRGGTSYRADGCTVRSLRSSDSGNRDSVEGKAMREVGFFWIVVLGSLPALTAAASAATGAVPGMI